MESFRWQSNLFNQVPLPLQVHHEVPLEVPLKMSLKISLDVSLEVSFEVQLEHVCFSVLLSTFTFVGMGLIHGCVTE